MSSSDGMITAEGLKAVLERKVSQVLGGLAPPDVRPDQKGRYRAAALEDARIVGSALAIPLVSRANPHCQYEISVKLAEGFAPTRAAVVRVSMETRFEPPTYNAVLKPRARVDFDRFVITLKVRRVTYSEEDFDVLVTPAVSKLLIEMYRPEEDDFIFAPLITLQCASITPAVVNRLLAHIRLLDNIAACSGCGAAFVRGLEPGSPEACEECLMRATPQQLQEVATCTICQDEANTSFSFKCPDCTCLLHQSCLLRLWKENGCEHQMARCPQCRRSLKRPAEATAISPMAW